MPDASANVIDFAERRSIHNSQRMMRQLASDLVGSGVSPTAAAKVVETALANLRAKLGLEGETDGR